MAGLDPAIGHPHQSVNDGTPVSNHSTESVKPDNGHDGVGEPIRSARRYSPATSTAGRERAIRITRIDASRHAMPLIMNASR